MFKALVLGAALCGAAVAEETPAGSDGWNSTDFCHSPSDPGCEQCCIEETGSSPGWTVLSWTGDCSKCLPGQPYGPACGDCFPGVQPWYTEESFVASEPANCKPCSKCLRRVVSCVALPTLPLPRCSRACLLRP